MKKKALRPLVIAAADLGPPCNTISAIIKIKNAETALLQQIDKAHTADREAVQALYERLMLIADTIEDERFSVSLYSCRELERLRREYIPGYIGIAISNPEDGTRRV